MEHFRSCFALFCSLFLILILSARLLADKLFSNIYITSAYVFQRGKDLLLYVVKIKRNREDPDLPKVKGHDKWMTPEALGSKVQLESHNLHLAFYITKESSTFLTSVKEFITMFTFFYEKLFQNDSAHDYFSLETKWHEIGFYISWMSPYSFINIPYWQPKGNNRD